MSQDVSIAFKASDNLSHSIKEMRKNVGTLSKDVSEYREIQDKTFRKKTEVKIEITRAKQELKELERAMKNSVEGSEQAYRDRHTSLDRLNEEYRRLTQVAKDASRAERQLQEDMSRRSNRNATRTSTMTALAGAGLGNLLGGAISNGLEQQFTSIFGSTTGQGVSQVMGGLTSGIALGSIAGPIGAAVGGAVGGLAGAINALATKNEKDDDFFRNETKSLYEKATGGQESSLETGINLASTREQDFISFSTLLGSEDNANKFLKDAEEFATRTPYEIDNLLSISKKMFSYKYEQDEIIDVLTKVGDAGSALGLDTQNQNMIVTALGRMKASDKASLEYINLLTERAVPVMDYLSEEYGKSQKEIYKMISKNQLSGKKVSQLVLNRMGEDYKDSMLLQSETYGGLSSTLSDIWASIDRAKGEGYNEKRKEGMDKEKNQLTGDIGNLMKDANKLIGEFEADLENKYQQSIINAVKAVQESEEFQKARLENDGAKMGELMATAKMKAEINHQNSDAYRLKLESEKNLIGRIQDALVQDGDYVEFGQVMAMEFEKGWSGAVEGAIHRGLINPSNKDGKEKIDEHGSFFRKLTTPNISIYKRELKTIETPSKRNSHATGLSRVPYNDYPATLHEGEQVLTRVEADKRKNENKPAPVINITVNNNSGNMVEITREIANELFSASERAGLL